MPLFTLLFSLLSNYHHLPIMPPTCRLGQEYAICYCTGCNGAIRTRRTERLHRDNYKAPGPDDKICYCSLHPLGQRFNRRTVLRHRDADREKGIFNVQIRPEDLGEVLWDVGDYEREAVTQELQRIRDAAELVEGLKLDEADDGAVDIDATIPDGDARDADEQDQEEVLDDQETLDRIFPTSLPEGAPNSLLYLNHC
jgi:hypothetical protein